MRVKAPAIFVLAILAAAGARADRFEAQPTGDTIGYELEEIRDLALKVESRARSVRIAAERRLPEGDDREDRQALDRLWELEGSAARFHAQVDRERRSPGAAEDDFYAVQRAYVRANRAMRSIAGRRNVDRRFDRLSDAMYELEMYAVDLFTRIQLASQRDRDLELLDGSDVGKANKVAWAWPDG